MCFAHRAIPPRPEGRGFPRNRMKKSALLLTTLALGVTSAFAAPPATSVAPAAPASVSPTSPGGLAANPVLAPAKVEPAPSKVPGQAASPSSAAPVRAPADTVAATALKKAKPKKKKRKPKVKAIASQPSAHVPSAYEVAVAEHATRHAVRERHRAAARWSQVETTGCAFMGPVYEKVSPATGALRQVELPSTAMRTPFKLTTTAPWLTAKQQGNQLVVMVDANQGEFRRAHVALETPGVFCDVVVHQASASN